MTIQEAIKSKKPFHRKRLGVLWLVVDKCGWIIWKDTKENLLMNKEDILAEDWEIKQ